MGSICVGHARQSAGHNHEVRLCPPFHGPHCACTDTSDDARDSEFKAASIHRLTFFQSTKRPPPPILIFSQRKQKNNGAEFSGLCRLHSTGEAGSYADDRPMPYTARGKSVAAWRERGRSFSSLYKTVRSSSPFRPPYVSLLRHFENRGWSSAAIHGTRPSFGRVPARGCHSSYSSAAHRPLRILRNPKRLRVTNLIL